MATSGPRTKGRTGPPTSIDELQAALEAMNTRRRLIRLQEPLPATAEDAARLLGANVSDIVATTLAAVDGSYVAVLTPAGARISLPRLAELLGARRAQLVGPRQAQAWLGRRERDDTDTVPLEWWHVPFITGLPTVISQALQARDVVFLATGDALAVVRMEPAEARRVTSAVVADVARPVRAQSHP